MNMDQEAQISTENDFLEDVVYSTQGKWKPIGLTHVEYTKGDLVGLVLAWSSLLPIFLGVSFVTLIIFRRDLHTICYLAGILINEVLNLVLKHVIREPRPDRTRAGLTSEFGMPSNHAQYMWFFSTYLVFFLLIRVHSNIRWIDNVWKYATAVGGIVTAGIVSYSRLYLGYHSGWQVLCGSAVGACTGTLWFGTVHLVLTPLFPKVAASGLGEFLMLRDSTLIPNVLWFEYCSNRNEARSRQRKRK